MIQKRDGFDWWLAGICLARAFNGVVFMTYAATLPVVQHAWGMSASSAGTIAGAFQIAYALSLVVMSNLADRLGPKMLYLGSMTASALFSLLFAIFARDFWSGIFFYTLVGLSLGGNYTTALMIMADRYPVHKRGSAMGFFIASTSLGYAISLAICGATIPIGGYRLAFWATCFGPVVGAMLAWGTLIRTRVRLPVRRQGQHFSKAVIGNRPVMTLIWGYTGHSWELLGMWAWTPAFLSACLMLDGSGSLQAAGKGAYITSVFHFTGLIASFSMGALSDRLGRAKVMMVLAGISSLCSFIFGWAISLPFVLILALGIAYSFASLGDSPILSAALTEVVDSSYMGSAFGLRSLLGFGAGAISPLLFGVILDFTNPAVVSARGYAIWGWAYGALGIGGLVALVAAWMTGRMRRSRVDQ